LIGSLGVLQALYDGQHSPAGTGAGVPSGQILRSIVQKVLAQFGRSSIGLMVVLQALYDGQHSPTGTGAGVPSGQILRSKVQATLEQSVLQALND